VEYKEPVLVIMPYKHNQAAELLVIASTQRSFLLDCNESSL